MSLMQAEYVRVPMADSTLITTPENVSDKEALLVGDVLSTGTNSILYTLLPVSPFLLSPLLFLFIFSTIHALALGVPPFLLHCLLLLLLRVDQGASTPSASLSAKQHTD